jgi:predicted dehydrogenase
VDPTIRIGIVGAGMMGQRHAMLVADSNIASLAGFADPDSSAALDPVFAKVKYYRDHLKLIEAEAPDGIIIAVPNAHHAPVAMDCLAAGIPVLVEKPIADSVESGRALAAEQHKSGVAVLVGHHRRFDPAVDAARRLLNDGGIGKLLAVQTTWVTRKPEHYYHVKWRTERSSGGFILINLVHDIDMLRYLCGEIISVYAELDSVGRSLTVADTAAVTLRFENGVLGTVTASDACVSVWGWEQATGENPIVPISGESAVRFFGTTGSLDFPTLKLWRDAAGGAGTWDRVLASKNISLNRERNALKDQFSHFCALIKSDEQESKVTAEDGLATLVATTAIIESAEQKRPITINEAVIF